MTNDHEKRNDESFDDYLLRLSKLPHLPKDTLRRLLFLPGDSVFANMKLDGWINTCFSGDLSKSFINPTYPTTGFIEWVHREKVLDRWESLGEKRASTANQFIELFDSVESFEQSDGSKIIDSGKTSKYSFIFDEVVWKITFNGESLPSIKNIDGMQYIHELIKGPEEGISCQDLYAPKISGDYNPFTEKPDSNADIGMSAADEIIDQATIDSVRLKKEEAKKELESLLLSGGPNSEEEEERERELDAEIEGLDKYLSKGTDKQGKPKTVSPNDKKNIQNKVCNAIGRAIKEIKSHNPEVGKYFEKMIDKGSTCLFKDHSSEWYT